MYTDRIAISSAFTSILILMACACGPSSGGPSPDVCQPAPDAHSESCWINDQQKMRVTTADELTQICESKCSKTSDLRITNVEGLKNFEFLQGVTQIDTLLVTQNPDLESLQGLDQVESVTKALSLRSNPKLKDISALRSSVSSLNQSLTIIDNNSLSSLNGLHGLEALNTSGAVDIALEVAENDQLEGVSALSSLKRVQEGQVTIRDNPKLKAIDGLGKVTEFETLQIYDNETLNDITALYGVETISNDLDISDNPNLPQCQADKIANEAEVMGRTTLSGNGSGECR